MVLRISLAGIREEGTDKWSSLATGRDINQRGDGVHVVSVKSKFFINEELKGFVTKGRGRIIF